MSNFFSVNLNDTQEQKPAPKGQYELQITSCQLTETGEKSKNPGKPMWKIGLGFTDLELNAPNITHYVTLPYEGDENINLKLIGLKRFLVAFDIPYGDDGLDFDDLAYAMVGKTAVVGVDQSDPNENGDIYNRIIVPRLREEANGAGKGKAPGRRAK